MTNILTYPRADFPRPIDQYRCTVCGQTVAGKDCAEVLNTVSLLIPAKKKDVRCRACLTPDLAAQWGAPEWV